MGQYYYFTLRVKNVMAQENILILIECVYKKCSLLALDV